MGARRGSSGSGLVWRGPAARRRLGPMKRYKAAKGTVKDLRTLQRDIYDGVAAVRKNGKQWTIRTLTAVTFLYLWLRCIPATGLLSSIVLAGAVTFGLRLVFMAIWFAYRKRKLNVGPVAAGKQIAREKTIRRQWLLACEVVGFKRIPALRNLKPDPDGLGGFVAEVKAGTEGLPVNALYAKAEDMSCVIGCREIAVQPIVDRDGNYGSAKLRFQWSDPLAKIVPPASITVLPPGAAPIGVTDAATTMAIPVLNSAGESILTPMLVGGVSGSGKSTFNHAFLAGLIVQGIPVRLRIIDPAGGVEFAAYGDAWRDGAGTDRFRVVEYVDDAGEADALIARSYADMAKRMASITERRVRAHVPTLEEPLDIIVVDELLLLDTVLKKGSAANIVLGKYMSVCRKAGFGLMANTQQGHADAIGTIRERFRQRIAFATMSTEQTTTIMGSGQGSLLPPAHRIKGQPGTGYAFNAETNVIDKFRGVRFDDEQVERIARGLVPRGWEHLALERPEPVIILPPQEVARGGLHVVREPA